MSRQSFATDFELNYQNIFSSALPSDPLKTNEQRQVSKACFSYVKPKNCPNPKLIAHSNDTASILDLTEQDCLSPLFLELVSGNYIPSKAQPYAMRYGGHQFGNWAGQLGDGRAINLTEIVNKKKELWTIQLKGSGKTPYSRGADGLAVLRSSLREFLCSEAMFHLGVPTTRALSLTLTGEHVERDILYDGNPKLEPGAITCRVAQNFIRFGNFEILAANSELDELTSLIDFCMEKYFCPKGFQPNLRKRQKKMFYLEWFREICIRTAHLIAKWMSFGFVHGVLNTDNMSIMGLTIDYGPYGWLEEYDPLWTPNTTDYQGRRYCYGRQPEIGLWNLTQLANSLMPIISDKKELERCLLCYHEVFSEEWNLLLSRKLGFRSFDQKLNPLFGKLFDFLPESRADWTIFFRLLAKLDLSKANLADMLTTLSDAFYDQEILQNASVLRKMENWLSLYIQLNLELGKGSRKQLMNSVNPNFVLRNYLSQIAIDEASAGNYTEIINLQSLLKTPFNEFKGESERYLRKRPKWANNKPGCSMLSCSS